MLRHGTELEPDPRFARRLRGIVLSRHVEAQEASAAVAHRSSMTPIGRGVLVSSVLLAMSAATVGAFSQSALPDDLLYPLKLRIEAMRMAVAPADLRNDLLALAFEERASELTRAAAAGRWNAAEEAAWRVMAAEQELTAIGGLTPAVAARVDAHLRALDQVLAHAPPTAAATVTERLTPTRSHVEGRGQGNRGGSGNAGGPTQGPGSAPAESGGPAASPEPSRGGGPADGSSTSPAPGQPAPTNRPAASDLPPRPSPRSAVASGSPPS